MAECVEPGPVGPCQHRECRYHLAHRGYWEHQLTPTRDCALDVANEGPHTLEQVGAALGISGERVRQLEEQAMASLRQSSTLTLSVVAWVNPLAQIKFATPRFQKVERHQCGNNPTWSDCECRKWFDPESGGPWGQRETPAHHPLCIFDPGAKRRWQEVEVVEKVSAQAEIGRIVSANRGRAPMLLHPYCSLGLEQGFDGEALVHGQISFSRLIQRQG